MPGNHVLYAWASDDTDATDIAMGESAIGAIAAYPFTVVIPPTAQRAVLTMNCATVTYDGNPHSCTGTALAADGVTPVSGSWIFAPASKTDAGNYRVAGTFISSDPNYMGDTVASTLTINQAASAIACESSMQYTPNPVSPCYVTNQAGVVLPGKVTYVKLGVPSAAWINSTDHTLLSLSTAVGSVTVAAATWPGTNDYLPATIPTSTPLVFTTTAIPVNINCTYTPLVSATGATGTIANLPATATYGDSGMFGCQSDSTKIPAPILTYTATRGLKSTVLNEILTFKAAETVTLTVTTPAGLGYAAGQWPPAGSAGQPGYSTVVSPKAVTIQSPNVKWTYGSPAPVLAAPTFTPPLVGSDRITVTQVVEDPNRGNAAVVAATAPLTEALAGLGYSNYQVVPKVVTASYPNYTITPLNGTMTYIAGNPEGLNKIMHSPTSLTFATTALNPAKPQTLQVRVTNNIGSDLEFTLNGLDLTNFTVNQSSCRAYRDAPTGTACTFIIGFNPQVAQKFIENLTITATDNSTGQLVYTSAALPLTAYSYGGFTVTPSSLSFPAAGGPGTLTVNNNTGWALATGTIAGRRSTISVTGNTCVPATTAATCSLTLLYTPTAKLAPGASISTLGIPGIITPVSAPITLPNASVHLSVEEPTD